MTEAPGASRRIGSSVARSWASVPKNWPSIRACGGLVAPSSEQIVVRLGLRWGAWRSQAPSMASASFHGHWAVK